jgi:hypothetical protein
MFVQAADPSDSWIVFTVPTEHVMNLIDETQSQFPKFLVTR